MILVADDDFGDAEEAFKEAYYTHTSTSPNLQIIASLDIARRQMELEGYELVLLGAFRSSPSTCAISQPEPDNIQVLPGTNPHAVDTCAVEARCAIRESLGYRAGDDTVAAIEADEFFLDPTR